MRQNRGPSPKCRPDRPFYQLDADRREMKPILIDEVAGPMQVEVAKALELRSRLGLDSSDAVDLDDDLRERLEALGYLDN